MGTRCLAPLDIAGDPAAQQGEAGASPKKTVYFFVKYYPNPFKPYLETQLAQLIRDGHSVRLFALGTWKLSQSVKARTFGFDRLLIYLPSTVRSAARMLPVALTQWARNPSARWALARRAWKQRPGLKHGLLDVQRTMLMPLVAPEVCLVHDLATLRYVTFLKAVYPSTRVALYFHGGDIPKGDAVDDRSARRAFETADVVFTNTNYSRTLTVRRGCPPQKIIRVPVGFDLDEYRPANEKRYRNPRLRILFVGRLSEEKGLEFLLRGFETLTNAHRIEAELRIVGYGPLDARLRNDWSGHRHIHFLGEHSHTRVLEELQSADVVVVPSIPFNRGDVLQEETQATVVQEALLMKTLVVAARSGGIMEGVPPEMHDFSVPPGDAAAIATRLARIAHIPHPELVRLGELGRAFVMERYDVGHLNHRIIASTLSAVALGE